LIFVFVVCLICVRLGSAKIEEEKRKEKRRRSSSSILAWISSSSSNIVGSKERVSLSLSIFPGIRDSREEQCLRAEMVVDLPKRLVMVLLHSALT
jgi:hypothetical protein